MMINKSRRYASLPPIVEPEITKPIVWTLEFSIPLGVLEKYAGQLGTIKGTNLARQFL